MSSVMMDYDNMNSITKISDKTSPLIFQKRATFVKNVT